MHCHNELGHFLHKVADNPCAAPGRCFVVGEVGQAHEGSLGMAHSYIDAIADAGADAVKFQTHIADAESSPHEPWRVKFSPQDETRFAYWHRMEFTEFQWRGLKVHAAERKLLFLSSPFSVEAVELLSRVGVDAWKIASGEVGSADLFERIAATDLPVLLSTGMSTMDEISHAVNKVRHAGLPLAVFQCTSSYPCPPEQVGLNLLDEFRQRFQCAVGLSDHSGTIFPGLAAVTLGASILEVHVTFSRRMFGPDVPASLAVDELVQLVEGVHAISRMLSSPVDKDTMAQSLQPLRQIFTKSLVAKEHLPAGTVLANHHLTAKKPGTGIPAESLSDLIGRRLRRAVQQNQFLAETDVE